MVRVYGDTAIVTGRLTQKGSENGKDYSGDYPIHKSPGEGNGPLGHSCAANHTPSAFRFSTVAC
jgi:hypothetical protein